MKKLLFTALLICFFSSSVFAATIESVVDLPTRQSVMQRILVLEPDHPQAAAILFAGKHGGLQIGENGALAWGTDNFLVRTSKQFAEKGIFTILIDAPSDRQSKFLSSYLTEFRQTPEHVVDVKSVIAWVRQKQPKLPVWLIGTSRGTQSAAFVATELAGKPEGPDGLVLTSTILHDNNDRAVLDMPLERLTIPVLVVHHKSDGCVHCFYSMTKALMDKLVASRKKYLMTFDGGINQGDPCGAFAHHGFNGLDNDVVNGIVDWILEQGR